MSPGRPPRAGGLFLTSSPHGGARGGEAEPASRASVLLAAEERFAAVEVPEYGKASLIEGLRPDPIGRPETALAEGEAQRSPVEGLPGAYVQLPFGDPHLERRVYEKGGVERLPLSADASREMAEARARHRAAMLCELGPPPRAGR